MTTGLWQLVRLQWRTSRGMLLVAPALLAALVTAVAGSIASLYPQPEQRDVYRQTMGASPASAAFNGRGYDLEHLGGIAAYEVGFMGQLALPVVGLVMAIRLTRRLEDAGILELVTSGRVARTAVPLAAALSSTGAWLLFWGLGAAGLVAQDFPTSGSLRYVTVMALFGLAYSAAGLLLGQAAATARSATAAGMALILATFLVRAVVDGRNTSWTGASPMGWVAEAHPWGAWRWWPVLAFVALALLLVAGAVGLAARRDLGAGLLAPRPGRPTAGARLATPLGLAWRLGSSGLWGWGLGAVAWAAAIGSMSQEFVDVVEANPSLAEAFGGDASRLSVVLALLLTQVMAMAAGLGLVLRLGAEEMSGRMGLLHAGRLPRLRWWLAFTGLALVGSAATSLAAAAALGLMQARVMDRPEVSDDPLRAAVWLLAPTLMVVAFGALLVAVAPRWRALAWLPVTWVAVVGIVGEPLRLPEWSRDLSPLHLVGQVPMEAASRPATVALAAALLAALALGLWGSGRRDLARG